MIEARKSAVFLIASALIVCMVSIGEPAQRGSSVQKGIQKRRAGVGTNHGGSEVLSLKRPTGDKMPDVQPITIFRAIEAGIRSSNVKEFGGFLGRERVFLEIDEGGPRGGRFAKGQAYYLLVDYLKETRTLRIDLAKLSEAKGSEGKPFALFERVYRTRTGAIRKEMIFVCLGFENDSWVISEFRVIPAE
ncbi:MAG: hypothetical protein ACUVUU_04155 [bacterium]